MGPAESLRNRHNHACVCAHAYVCACVRVCVRAGGCACGHAVCGQAGEHLSLCRWNYHPAPTTPDHHWDEAQKDWVPNAPANRTQSLLQTAASPSIDRSPHNALGTRACAGFFAVVLAGLAGLSLVKCRKVQETMKLEYDAECKPADSLAEARGEDHCMRDCTLCPSHEPPVWTLMW